MLKLLDQIGDDSLAKGCELESPLVDFPVDGPEVVLVEVVAEEEGEESEGPFGVEQKSFGDKFVNVLSIYLVALQFTEKTLDDRSSENFGEKR